MRGGSKDSNLGSHQPTDLQFAARATSTSVGAHSSALPVEDDDKSRVYCWSAVGLCTAGVSSTSAARPVSTILRATSDSRALWVRA